MLKLASLPDRAVIAVGGPDRVSFLQGLVSNDVSLVAPGQAIWAALLTPQGKWLADFFILHDQDRLLLDCERAQATMLIQRLTRFRLRSKVELSLTDLHVHAAWDGEPRSGPGGLWIAPDPRLPEAGWRVLAASPQVYEMDASGADAGDWDRHRLLLGLPEGSRDCESEKTLLLEAGFDELGGISWTKGCYMGQELTARTRYRGLLKRRLVPVASTAALPPAGTILMHGGVEIGSMRSSRDTYGIALLRLEHLHTTIEADGHALHARIPAWMRLPVPPTEPL